MQKAGVPTITGSEGLIESEEQAIKIAADIGYPVMIKAARRRRRSGNAASG